MCVIIVARAQLKWVKKNLAEMVIFSPLNFDTLNPSNSSGDCGYPLLLCIQSLYDSLHRSVDHLKIACVYLLASPPFGLFSSAEVG